MTGAETTAILLAALGLDRIVGDPDWLWRRLTHPVVLFGAAIGWTDQAFNRDGWTASARKAAGTLSIAGLLLASIMGGAVLQAGLVRLGTVGLVLQIGIVAVFLAQKSLSDHVLRVADGFRLQGLEGGRWAVSMIVGRDPDVLDEAGVCRAAIESLAENFSDGVVAPVFWYGLFGLPGLLAYKMLNTADSMIGHKTPRHLSFGWASARLDDLANLPAARLSALFVAIGAAFTSGLRSATDALTVALRDHGLHRSPNSGWPEAAMAGALRLQLAGPRVYDGVMVGEPMINAPGSIAAVQDIHRAVRVFWAACTALAGLVFVCLAVPIV